MKSLILKTLPWLITLGALYFAFRGVDIVQMGETLITGDPTWIIFAIIFTVFSYLLRAYRWQFFFPSKVLNFRNSYQVLILGFFMNNILPARAGEIIRAHLGAKFAQTKRTLVLATVASERLADGLTLSLMFLLYVVCSPREKVSNGMLLVAGMFLAATICVIILLLLRKPIFQFAERIAKRFSSKVMVYAVDRLQVFINGLAPMFNRKRLPLSASISLFIWIVELFAYYFIVQAFDADLSFFSCILFLVAVNFSALIPSAPAGVGVIEAVASGVSVAHGMNKELALSMVISQHLIQFLVIALPGIYYTVTLKKELNAIKLTSQE